MVQICKNRIYDKNKNYIYRDNDINPTFNCISRGHGRAGGTLVGTRSFFELFSTFFPFYIFLLLFRIFVLSFSFFFHFFYYFLVDGIDGALGITNLSRGLS